MYNFYEYINITKLLVDGHSMHQDHNACGSLTVIMSSQEASEWSIKTAKVNPIAVDTVRFNDRSTKVTNTLDEIAIFVMGGGGFNVENGHEIASSSKCGRRYSIQIIVKLEESVKKLHEYDEKLYLEVKDYSRRLALENQAIDILRQHHHG